MTPEEKKLDKLTKLLELADQEYTTPQEVADVVDVLAEIIQTVQATLENKISDSESNLTSKLEDFGYSLKEASNNLERLVTDAKKAALSDTKDLSSRLGTEVNRLESLISSVVNQIPDFDTSKLDLRLKAVETSANSLTLKVSEVKDDISTLKTKVESFKEVDDKRLSDIEQMARANAMPITTTHFSLNGTTKGRAKNINFKTGSSLNVQITGDQADVTIPTGGGSGGGHVIQDEGVDLTQRTNLNFVGTGVAATDDAGNDATKVTINRTLLQVEGIDNTDQTKLNLKAGSNMTVTDNGDGSVSFASTGGSGGSVSSYSISSQFDGNATTFTVPSYTSIVAVIITGWPPNGVLEATTDFTTPSSTSIALTSQVTAPEAGATGVVIYNTSAPSASFINNEVVSGSGTTFTLAATPLAGTEHIHGAGQRLTPGVGNDYTISGAVITTVNSYSAGQILADYQT